MSNSFFRILSKPFHDEHYRTNRRSKSKTVRVNGGKIPDSFELWESFENEVTHFIDSHSAQLQAHSVPGRIAPRLLGVEISNEAEVRTAIYLDCAQVVEGAMRTCLGTDYFIESGDSGFMRGNMDYAGFMTNPTIGDLETVVLPIEIKGPWQLNVRSWKNLPRLMNSGEKASSRVRNAIALIFMYMVLSETQYGVLCTKSTYFFFRRVGSPDEKHLEVSRTICCNSTSPSVRQC